MDAKLKFSIVIPVHNGGDNFRRCLESLAVSIRAPEQVIVVDDASTDASALMAHAWGAQVISWSDRVRGAAHARNVGAEIATGDVLCFLDADISLHPDSLERMDNYLSAHPELAAVFGSYDDAPAALDWVSQYKNLLHYYVHQHGERQAFTFWTGCGAIRREIFMAFGGFDESWKTMEDVELGARLHHAGQRVWLCADVQVKHLKRWTFLSLLHTDIFGRAVPWALLLLQEKNLPADLNLNWRSRASAFAAWLGVMSLALGFFSAPFWIIASGALVSLLAWNVDFYRFLAKRGGTTFALVAMGLHVLYYLYSSLTFGILMINDKLQKLFQRVLRLWPASSEVQ